MQHFSVKKIGSYREKSYFCHELGDGGRRIAPFFYTLIICIADEIFLDRDFSIDINQATES